MEDEEFSNSNIAEEKILISTNKFIILNIVTFNLYGMWWIYKSWDFFKKREGLDILPAVRALFGIFFIYELFNKILDFAKSKGYEKDYSPGLLLIALIAVALISYIPGPMWVIALSSSMFYVKPFEALNYAIEASDEYSTEEQQGFNALQTALIVLGIMLWVILIIGILNPAPEQKNF